MRRPRRARTVPWDVGCGGKGSALLRASIDDVPTSIRRDHDNGKQHAVAAYSCTHLASATRAQHACHNCLALRIAKRRAPAATRADNTMGFAGLHMHTWRWIWINFMVIEVMVLGVVRAARGHLGVSLGRDRVRIAPWGLGG